MYAVIDMVAAIDAFAVAAMGFDVISANSFPAVQIRAEHEVREHFFENVFDAIAIIQFHRPLIMFSH